MTPMSNGLFETPPTPALLRKYFGPDAVGPLEHWPPERLRAYQTEAIAEQLAHAHANNRLYQRKFDEARVGPGDFRALEDLGRFPFTSRDELRGDPWALLAVPRHEVRLAHTSTGTTGGAWSYLLYSWEDMYVRDLAPFPRLLMPVGDADVVLNALPYEMSSSGQSFQRSLQGVAGCLVVPAGKGGFYADPYKSVQIMADLKATVLITTPPYALLLAEVAAQLGVRPGTDVPLRFMWLTGEGCAPAYRRRLEEAWRCPGLVFYGSMECGCMAIECSRQAGGHVCGGHIYLEVIDPSTGRPAPPGQAGEVVCTVLQRKASPLIRYRTQDLGFFEAAGCPCGVRLPRLVLRGRVLDQVAEAGTGCSISPYVIEEALYSQPEVGNNYQVYADQGGLLVEAECRAAADGREAARQRILGLLRQRGLQAKLAWVDHIPRTGGKTRRIRPLSERGQVMASASLLRQPGPDPTHTGRQP
jgi:phenylacetate-CoA ligase